MRKVLGLVLVLSLLGLTAWADPDEVGIRGQADIDLGQDQVSLEVESDAEDLGTGYWPTAGFWGPLGICGGMSFCFSDSGFIGTAGALVNTRAESVLFLDTFPVDYPWIGASTAVLFVVTDWTKGTWAFTPMFGLVVRPVKLMEFRLGLEWGPSPKLVPALLYRFQIKF